MSEPAVAMVVLAVLFEVLPSLVAPVVPLTGSLPGAVGVPETVQVILAPGATVAGGEGAHDAVTPGGRPETAQLAFVAAIIGAPPLVQVNVPE